MRNRIVVTGLGALSPCGNTVAENWENIKNGRSGISRITKFDASAYSTQIAGEVKDFDAAQFIAKKEIKKMDQFIHYAMAAAKEALDDSGLVIDESNADQTGVSIGVGIGGLPNIQHYASVLSNRGPGKITPFFIPMTISNMASGFVAIEHGAKGYNATTTSACSSANHSIGDAARIIERGDAKVMIVGGTEAAICGLSIGGFGAMKALSRNNDNPTGASRPYDKNRDGFILSEGAGILILEEMEYAQERGAKIYGELSGYGFSSDAFHMTTPSSEGPTRAIAMALKDAGLSGADIDYINSHGTSTPAGDVNELIAITAAFGKSAQKVAISSTKSMTGHLLGAAGGLEAVLTLKAMEEGFVPPTINVDELDEACDLDITPNQGRTLKIEAAMSNSFGFGGTNATLIFSRV